MHATSSPINSPTASPAQRFDVVVLGGGTAGETAATELARAGRAVTLVESGLVGGERSFYACMPSKSLLHSARRGETWELAVARREEITDHLEDKAGADRLAEAGVTLTRGYGRVEGPGALAVTTSTEDRTEQIGIAFTDLVLCTGSEPAIPAIEGLARTPFWTTDQALTCPDLPRRLVVLGGDPAGCELAQVYAAFGSQVTIIEAAPRLLAAEAPFVGEALAESLHRMGIDLRLGTEAVWVERIEPGTRLLLSDGGMVDADRIMVSAGRRPRVDGLGLEALGIEPGPGGGLIIDETCRVVPAISRPADLGGPGTTGGTGETGGLGGSAGGDAGERAGGDARLWAAGDVTGLVASTHAAAYQARVVVANLLGGHRQADYRAIPRVVHTTPSVCAVGVSPITAGELGVEPVTAGRDLATTARSAIEGDDRGRVELYADPVRGVLVGGAAVGPQAEEWMSEITLAIRAEIPVGALCEVVHAFPSYGETIEPPLRELAERL